jgi:membrane-bound lytic murein transglycosylase D
VKKSRTTPNLAWLLGIILALSACSASRQSSLPRQEVGAARVKAKASVGLIPEDYLCPDGPKEALDPQLGREVKAFLDENGMLKGVSPEFSSELPVVLNGPVKSYVRLFTGSQKAGFATYLARSGRYLPMMRRIFQEQGLPQDLVYLCLVESGFNPWAKSPAEALGPWQFIKGTAQRYGLRVNGWVDERRDPEKSTRAAARYLKDLHRQFGCWYLAAAGYNAGEKRVEGALGRQKGQSFWDLAQNGFLPRETCNYVPQLIAAALIAKSPEKYGFAGISYLSPWRTARVKVPGGVDLGRFAETLGVPLERLKELNPELLKDATPGDRREYLMQVPAGEHRQANLLAKACWKGQD